MRRRVLLAALPLLACGLCARASWAQDATPPPSPPPSGGSIPSGASGAMIVPPKDEPPPPPQQVALVPPRVKDDPGAVYPRQALDDGVSEPVTVTVLVEVDREGHVTKASVPTPAGHGFDEAAMEAAKGLVFEPATRDGTAIASRVKHAYVFTPPAARLVGRVVSQETLAPIEGARVDVRAVDGTVRTTTTGPDGRWAAEGVQAGTYHVVVAATGFKPHEADETVKNGQEASTVDRLEPQVAAPVVKSEVQEVYVRGTPPPRDVTVRTLDQRELERIPGTNGDALKGLLNLPGVARPPGISGLLIVRGSAPQDTQVFVDGTPIPLVYHFGGLSSVVPTEMLSKIDFFPGNYSAQYGRGMGGIVNVGIADPKSDKLHGLAQVDLIDTRVMAQGPIVDTGFNFSVALRPSWVDL